jgi:hypothetical protein
MGDLNENHDEFFRQDGKFISALLPDDPKAAELAAQEAAQKAAQKAAQDDTEPEGEAEWQKDFLILSGEKPPRSRNFSSGIAFYSPWENTLTGGSYSYKNEWETIDHFLLTGVLFDEKGWEFNSEAVIRESPFTAPSGYPDPYNPRNGSGLSDHLPLFLILKDTEDTGSAEGAGTSIQRRNSP